MHSWYWNYQYPDFFNEDDIFKYPKIDIYVYTDNIESGSNTHTNNAESSSSNYTSNAVVEGSNSNSNELKIIYEKIVRQYNYNKSSVNRGFNIYSPHHPVDSQLTDSECVILHRHLLDLNKGYHLRLVSTNKFRMFVSFNSDVALKPSLTLLSDIDS
jgi:hypothetical protein